MLTKDQFQALAKKAIGFTSFPECSVNLSNTENAFIRFALNGVTTSGFDYLSPEACAICPIIVEACAINVRPVSSSA